MTRPPSTSSAVIRAKVVGEKEVNSGNDIYGNPIKRIEYAVKQIKVRPRHPKDARFLYFSQFILTSRIVPDVQGS